MHTNSSYQSLQTRGHQGHNYSTSFTIHVCVQGLTKYSAIMLQRYDDRALNPLNQRSMPETKLWNWPDFVVSN